MEHDVPVMGRFSSSAWPFLLTVNRRIGHGSSRVQFRRSALYNNSFMLIYEIMHTGLEVAAYLITFVDVRHASEWGKVLARIIHFRGEVRRFYGRRRDASRTS